MKIELTNFRCYKQKTIELPDSGLIALSGVSSAGKSTIFSSIVYTLYGVIPGNYKKPYSHGEKTCKVSIEGLIKGTIIRTSSPNTVNYHDGDISLTGTAAQSKIEQLIGMNFEEFCISSYIVQGSTSQTSVISMTPTEQIRFINTLVNSSSETYKDQIRKKIKSVSDDITRNEGELKVLNQQILSAEAIIKKGNSSELQEDYNPEEENQITTEVDRLENRKKEINQCVKDINSQLEETRTLDKLASEKLDKLNRLKSEVGMLSELRAKLEKVTDEDITESKKTIETLTERVEYLEKSKDYFNNLTLYEEAKGDYLNNINKDIETLKNKILNNTEITAITEQIKNETELLTKYDKYQDIKNQREISRGRALELIRDIKVYFMDVFQVKLTFKKPKDYIKIIKEYITINETKLLHEVSEKIYSKTYECPKCKTLLAFGGLTEEKTLYEYEQNAIDITVKENDLNRSSSMEVSTENLAITNDRLKCYLEDLLSISKFCNKKELLNYYDSRWEEMQFRKSQTSVINTLEFKLLDSVKNSELLKEKENFIVNGMLPDYITNHLNKANEIFKDKQDVEFTFVNHDILEKSLKDRQDELDEASIKGENLLEIKRQYDEYTSKIDNKNKVIKSIGNPKKNSKTSQLEDSLAQLNNELYEIADSLTKLSQKERQLLLAKNYKEKVDNFNSMKNQINETKEAAKLLTSRLEASYVLEKHIKESEILSLESMTRTINTHAKAYIDEMFSTGDPITVELRCSKENRKGITSLKMNTYVYYRGEEVEDIEALSGGERQRCNAAFLLAVNEILNSKILMLDECLNSLDSTANTEALDFMKRCANKTNKLIIAISHEAIKGIFDEVVKITKE